ENVHVQLAEQDGRDAVIISREDAP
ncbi:MAG: hypothetical protein QOE94_327, partial [Mycobacterium sp.]|nr:hypothetical protein [Mycobacterium sp.]